MFSSRAPQSPRPHRPARITGRILLALALAIGVGVALAPGAPRAQAAACTTPVLDIVAHEDDSLLFQSPDLLHAIQQGWCVRTVFMTAGDDGRDQTYWQGREAGALAAYAQMAGVSNTWVQSDAGISGHPMPLYTLAGAPQVSLIFMRLPDGNADGSGFPSTGNTSMQQLWQNNIASLSAIDGSSSYTRQGLINTILALMQSFQPVQIRVQDYMGSYGDGDHSDHHTSAYIAQAAHQQYTTPHTFIGYMDYNTTLNPQNVTGTDLTNKQNAFYTYAPYDPNVCQTEAACSGTNYQFWLQRQYTVGSENGGTGSYQSPTANAGANQSVASNVQVQLDGSASSDPNGKALTYRWTQMGGPSVTLSSSTTVKPTFTSPYGPTTLLFQLVVNNGTSASAPADVTISVAAPAAGSGPPCPCSVFGSSATPTTANAPDTGSYELGMKFQVTNAGSVTGVRFYKGSQNTGTHTGSLWDANGNLLATATFTNETASGWQQVRFSNPVAIAANTTYVVSYHTDVGHFSVDRPYFTAANSNLYSEVPVRPMEDGGSAGSNGVYSDTGFPTNSYDASNYWVDVVFTTNYGSGSTAPTVTSVSPANGASGVVATSPVTATFSSAMNAATITTSTFTLKDSQGNAVSATVTYNSSTNTATLTPTVVLGASTTYTATLNGVQDTNGTPLQQAYSWSFTTAATSYATPPTVASVTPTSGATGIGLAPSVTATFSQQLDPATVTTSTVQLLDASHATVAATVAYNNSTSTVTLTPSAALAPGTTYTAVVHG